MTDGGPSTAPAVTVVVPAQRAGPVLGRQLEALSVQRDAPGFAVVVVLDAGEADDAPVASYRERLSIDTVVAPMRGAAAARNAGVAASGSSILLFCDADDVVGDGWVRSMVAEVERFGLAGSVMRLEPDVCPRWAQVFYESFDVSSVQSFYGVVPFVASSSMGVTRELFESTGGFDESFPGAGGEDVDLSIRICEILRARADRGAEVGVAGDGIVIGLADDESAVVRYRPRTTLRSIVRQRVGYSRGAALVLVTHDIGGIGTVASIDPGHFRSMTRSVRRFLVATVSFLALRGELRRRRRRIPATG